MQPQTIAAPLTQDCNLRLIHISVLLSVLMDTFLENEMDSRMIVSIFFNGSIRPGRIFFFYQFVSFFFRVHSFLMDRFCLPSPLCTFI
ncbi:hypothetical protein GDO78_009601 [Eleutherodactylus coqui]|uniref:Uncharacterized protein n=1 Tax=Eleutherodactylus coqui TaxID=57060 RepID=A0A8J6K7M3_ELECQ|nr:hypothetical protein GDO78_009601 [Eleutherodactylus coqui]